jgi:hypothetical protein
MLLWEDHGLVLRESMVLPAGETPLLFATVMLPQTSDRTLVFWM